MSDTMFKIRQIVSLVVFIGALSLMGMITKNPLMIVAYGAFFLAVAALIYFFMRKRQRHFEVTQSTSPLLYRIVGGVLLLLALASPLLVALRSSVINLPSDMTLIVAIAVVGGVTLLFMALIVVAIHLLNNKGEEQSFRVLAYGLIVIAAMIPGILMSRVDSTTSGIGSVYYVAMAVLILTYNGYALVVRQDT